MEGSQIRRIALLAGTTAGHVYTAVAVAEALQRRDPSIDILFIGAGLDAAAAEIIRRGYRLESIPASAYLRVGALGKIAALGNLARGALAARRILRRDQIDAAIGFGGYASAGGLLAARWLGLPLLVHDANALPGLTNRWLGRWADRIAVGYPEAGAFFDARKVEVTGNPVRAAFAVQAASRSRPHSPARVLMTGGSFGSGLFNRVGTELAARMIERGVPVEVWHLTGDIAAVDSVRAAYAGAAVEAKVEAATVDMPAALAWADFALTAAGTTLFECAATGLPIFAVPLAWASEDHQRHNVAAFAKLTGCGWVDGDQWNTDATAQHITNVLLNPTMWRSAVEAMRRAMPIDAADRVAAVALALPGR